MEKIKKKVVNKKRLNPVSRFTKKITDGVNRSVSSSAVGRSLLNYEGEEKAMHKSFFYNKFKNLIKKAESKKIKYNIQRKTEESCVVHAVHTLTNTALTALMRQYGVFFFSLGLYTLLIYFLGFYGVDIFNTSIVNLLFGVTSLVCALPMLISGKTLAESLCESRTANVVLFKLLGLSYEPFQKTREENHHIGALPFVLALLVGLISTFIQPLTMLLAFGVLLAMYTALVSPESGLIMLILAFPFISADIVKIVLLYLMVCYILKAVRGKRVFKFELTDYAVLAFAFVVFIGSFSSIAPDVSREYAFTTIACIFAYFLIVNTIKTRPWSRRIIFAIIFTLVYSVLLGIVQRFIVNADFILTEGIVADGLVKASFSSPTVLAQFIILFAFYLFALFIGKKMGFTRKLLCLMLCIATVVCLYFTMTPLAMCCFVAAGIFFFVLYSRKTLIAVILLGVAVPFSAYVIPIPVIDKINEYLSLGKDALLLRGQALKASFGLASDHIIGGSAAGSYSALYSQYSMEAIDTASDTYNTYFQMSIELGIIGLLVFACIVFLFFKCNFSMFAKCGAGSKNLYSAAGVSGILGILLMGFSENLWNEPHFILAFWIALGLCMAIKRQALIEQKGYNEYLLGNERYDEPAPTDEETPQASQEDDPSKRKEVI